MLFDLLTTQKEVTHGGTGGSVDEGGEMERTQVRGCSGGGGGGLAWVWPGGKKVKMEDELNLFSVLILPEQGHPFPFNVSKAQRASRLKEEGERRRCGKRWGEGGRGFEYFTRKTCRAEVHCPFWRDQTRTFLEPMNCLKCFNDCCSFFFSFFLFFSFFSFFLRCSDWWPQQATQTDNRFLEHSEGKWPNKGKELDFFS